MRVRSKYIFHKYCNYQQIVYCWHRRLETNHKLESLSFSLPFLRLSSSKHQPKQSKASNKQSKARKQENNQQQAAKAKQAKGRKTIRIRITRNENFNMKIMNRIAMQSAIIAVIAVYVSTGTDFVTCQQAIGQTMQSLDNPTAELTISTTWSNTDACQNLDGTQRHEMVAMIIQDGLMPAAAQDATTATHVLKLSAEMCSVLQTESKADSKGDVLQAILSDFRSADPSDATQYNVLSGMGEQSPLRTEECPEFVSTFIVDVVRRCKQYVGTDSPMTYLKYVQTISGEPDSTATDAAEAQALLFKRLWRGLGENVESMTTQMTNKQCMVMEARRVMDIESEIQVKEILELANTLLESGVNPLCDTDEEKYQIHQIAHDLQTMVSKARTADKHGLLDHLIRLINESKRNANVDLCSPFYKAYLKLVHSIAKDLIAKHKKSNTETTGTGEGGQEARRL